MKIFGPLPDQRTSKHMENSALYRSFNSFTGPNFFFNIRFYMEGFHTRILLPDSRSVTIRVFIGPPLFSLVDDRGPVDFAMSIFWRSSTCRYKSQVSDLQTCSILRRFYRRKVFVSKVWCSESVTGYLCSESPITRWMMRLCNVWWPRGPTVWLTWFKCNGKVFSPANM